jgi:hypothetical protein
MSRSDEVERIADHVTRFSLKGLEHYLKENEEKRKREGSFEGWALSPEGKPIKVQISPSM